MISLGPFNANWLKNLKNLQKKAPAPPPVKVKKMPPAVKKPIITCGGMKRGPDPATYKTVPNSKQYAKPLYGSYSNIGAWMGGWLHGPLGVGTLGPCSLTGLKPNTRYKIFSAGDKEITSWCKITTYSGNVSNYWKERNQYISAANATGKNINTGLFSKAQRYNPNQKYLTSDKNGNLQFSFYWWTGEAVNGKFTGSYVYGLTGINNNSVKYYSSLEHKIYVLEYAAVPSVPVIVKPLPAPSPKNNPRNPVIKTRTIPDIRLNPAPRTIPGGGIVPPGRRSKGGNVPKNPIEDLINNGKGKKNDKGLILVPPDLTKSRPRIIENEGDYDIVQSFYVNASNFNNSSTVDLCSVMLYFRTLPSKSFSRTGKENPYVRVCLLDMNEGLPNTKTIHNGSIIQLNNVDIDDSDDATVATKFEFEKPIRVRTNNYYAIAIDVSDVGFQLWFCKAGDRRVGTNKASPGPTPDAGGRMFINVVNNPDANQKKLLDKQKAKGDTQLKFEIEVAEYDTGLAQIDLVNADYEFLNLNADDGTDSFAYNSNDDQMMVGEEVYKAVTPETGKLIGFNTDRTVERAYGSDGKTPTGTAPTFTTKLTRGQDIVIAESYRITNASHLNGETTLTLATDDTTYTRHEVSVGSVMVVTGVIPHAYNGTYTVTDDDPNLDGLQIKYEQETNPGSYTSGGYATNAEKTDIYEVMEILSDTKIELSKGLNVTSRHLRYFTTVIGEVVIMDDDSNILYLDYSTASSANTNMYWRSGVNLNQQNPDVLDYIVGVDSGSLRTVKSIDKFDVSNFELDMDLDVPSTCNVRGKYNITYANTTDYCISNNDTFERQLYLSGPNNVDGYRESDGTIYTPFILSKSVEVLQKTANKGVTAGSGTGNFLYDSDGDLVGDKSMQVSLIFESKVATTKNYESPELDIDQMLLATTLWDINNDATDEHLPQSGNSVTRHISNKLTFGEGRNAEDIRVVMNSYRPEGTDIKVYAKILSETDSDSFVDKYWTELELVSPDIYSVESDKNDFREYEYGFPDNPPIDQRLAGTYTTTLDSDIVGCSTTLPAEITNGAVILISSDIFPENLFVAQVVDTSAGGATEFQINEAVSNSSIVDDNMKVDTLLTPYTAFNNVQNLNIVRYFTVETDGSGNLEAGGAFDTYHSVVIKTVLLSNNVNIVPAVDDYRVIGVSA
jgi:hypothetical protein